MNTKRYLLYGCMSIGLCFNTSYAITPTNVSIVVASYENSKSYTPPSYFPLLAYNNAFVFNPKKLRWHAYDSNGKIVNSGKASGGRHYCPDVKRACRTPVGHFRVVSKGGPGCKSGKYPLGEGGAPMPYCMFFSKYYGIHGSYDLPNYNASHGCIRVAPTAARWLSQSFIKYGTKVVVLPY